MTSFVCLPVYITTPIIHLVFFNEDPLSNIDDTSKLTCLLLKFKQPLN